MSENFTRDRLSSLAEQTEKQRQALADARKLCATAFEDMMQASDLEPIRAAIKRVRDARISEEVAKGILIAALEAELHAVKFELSRKS